MTPYEILGVAKDATPAEINKAYRSLAAKFHPDKSGTIDVEKFLEIGFARDLLIDPERRAYFDHTGKTDNLADRMSKLRSIIAELIQKAVATAIHQWHKEPEMMDLTVIMREHAKQAEHEFLRKKKDFDQGLARIKKLRGRFVPADGKPNVFEEIFATQELELQRHIDPLVEGLEVLAMAKEYLKDCKFNHVTLNVTL